MNQNPRLALLARIAALSTDQILHAVVVIGGGHVAEEQRLVRALLIEEVIVREGAETGDMLMDQMGL